MKIYGQGEEESIVYYSCKQHTGKKKIAVRGKNLVRNTFL